jgi:lipopolysaccharide export system permease protein
MKILDWYILKRFLITYIFTVAIIISVLIVIDLAEKIEDFNDPRLTAWKIISEYYLNFIPHYANMLSPLIIFIAAVFVTAKMATHTEIVAMLSSGMSLGRILVPYLTGSVVVAILVFVLYGWIVPNSNKVRHNFEDTYVRKNEKYFTLRNIHLQIAPKTFAYMESYDNVGNVGFRFTLEKIDNKQLVSKIEAPRIVWNEPSKKWTLESYRWLKFEKTKHNLKFGPKMDTVLPITPKDFEVKHLFNEQLTLNELDEHIAQLRLRGAENVETFLVEKYERLAYPFAIVILTVIGVIAAARKTRGGTGFQIAFGFILAFIYILLIVISRSFAQKGGIPPQLSAWIPNAVFCIIGYIMYRRVPK